MRSENCIAHDCLPSGKLSHNYGKSPFLMGKSTISTGPFIEIMDCSAMTSELRKLSVAGFRISFNQF